MLEERPEPNQGRVTRHPVEVGSSVDVYVPLRRRKSRGLGIIGLGLAFVLIAAGTGYGLGLWRTGRVANQGVGSAPLENTGVTASQQMPKSISRALVTDLKVTKRSVTSVKRSTEPKVSEVTTSARDTTAPPAPGYQTIMPPEPPPVDLPSPVPPVQALAELLYGQRLVAKTLVANYGWSVEAGEIIDLTVDRVWNDPAQLSHGVYVTFVAMAEGKGVRASGLLRYYGDGSEGNRYAIRDFMPSSVVRVGSW